MDDDWDIPTVSEAWATRHDKRGIRILLLVLLSRVVWLIIKIMLFIGRPLAHVWGRLPWSWDNRRARACKRYNKQREDSFAKLVHRSASAGPIRVYKTSSGASNADRFFGRFPAEIRRCILEHAFGQRTLHMDLAFVRPHLVLDELQSSRETGHAKINRRRSTDLDFRQVDWRWLGCVCHRSKPEEQPLSLGRLRSDPGSCAREGYREGCMVGEGECAHWPGEWPAKCQVGALGWLLSCRQAYMEGMEVLYKTNTIQISSEVLLRGLHEVLTPTVLSSITSLELVWNPRLLHIVKVFEGLEPEKQPTRQMPPIFPSLTHLHICLTSLEYVTIGVGQGDGMQIRTMEDLAENMPLSIDTLVLRAAPATTNVTVTYAEDYLWFETVRSNHIRSRGIDAIRDRESQFEGPEFWREIPAPNSSAQEDTSPNSLELGEGIKAGRGYWIHYTTYGHGKYTTDEGWTPS
ncbi:unnamed protein product [Clonostachys rhizophaga]|uniref:DUF7730 domain-containing protein n=1 Tax=Clonostachys rhizophaga TaxID=160324 RepID=A0A9N9YLA3_9HYPO|nr:unnamed protein product [Clonostachys rhizophaga]